MCKSANGRPESSSRSVFDSCSPSFSMYHSFAAAKFRPSTAQLSAMLNGGFPHIHFPAFSICLCVSATASFLSPDILNLMVNATVVRADKCFWADSTSKRTLFIRVLVAHAQKVELSSKSKRKDDRHDARTLARLARIDPELLGPVRHRSGKAQIHLTVIRARAELVRARTGLVNAARGLVKSYGERLPKCGTQQVSRGLAAELSAELREVLEPLLNEIESLNERIKEYDARMEQIAKESYPHVELLKQVKGVGTQIALTYVLTLDDPHRFAKSREVGCFLGLKPGRRDSGESQPQLHISKEGDRYLRTMLVQPAHYTLGPFGEDSDLRRWGLRLDERGGKNANKRALVAVARKLALLLHRVCLLGPVSQPLLHNP